MHIVITSILCDSSCSNVYTPSLMRSRSTFKLRIVSTSDMLGEVNIYYDLTIAHILFTSGLKIFCNLYFFMWAKNLLKLSLCTEKILYGKITHQFGYPKPTRSLITQEPSSKVYLSRSIMRPSASEGSSRTYISSASFSILLPVIQSSRSTWSSKP